VVPGGHGASVPAVSQGLRFVRRALRVVRSPRIGLRRVWRALADRSDPYMALTRDQGLDAKRLARATGATDVDQLWERLAARPHPARTAGVADGASPGGTTRVLEAAEAALAHRVDLLGSGPVELGGRIDWHADFKSGRRWPRAHFKRQQLVHLDDSSDVKVPWELSRFHWALPLGQAAILTGDDRYAEGARELLESWIEENPYSFSINWGVAMEPALRLLSWTWLFKVFAKTESWSDPAFRMRLLRSLYLHADFVERHLEEGPINGNHFTADATGLLVAGLFFGEGRAPGRWARRGWQMLERELPRQVYVDGVDFECATGYHRLVLELFLLAALYRRACGLDVPDAYRKRLVAMGRFAATYTRADGTAPSWGDADDARALPFGGQAPEDHGWVACLVGRAFGEPDLIETERSAEEAWWLLPEAGSEQRSQAPPRASKGFPEGGVYVMRNERDHVFVDCGPVGTGGLGGHGHNDCLGFEAVLDGVLLIVDRGSFVYTASIEERNSFRATAAHNTPRIDGEEINRIDPRLLWSLENDARPLVRLWRPGASTDVFCGGHSGYRRLPQPLTPWRSVVLEHATHRLAVHDRFEGRGEHRFEIPLHLAPGVSARSIGDGRIALSFAGREFQLAFSPASQWSLEIGESRASRRYGVAEGIVRLAWTRRGGVGTSLTVALGPPGGNPGDLGSWAAAALKAEGVF